MLFFIQKKDLFKLLFWLIIKVMWKWDLAKQLDKLLQVWKGGVLSFTWLIIYIFFLYWVGVYFLSQKNLKYFIFTLINPFGKEMTIPESQKLPIFYIYKYLLTWNFIIDLRHEITLDKKKNNLFPTHHPVC